MKFMTKLGVAIAALAIVSGPALAVPIPSLSFDIGGNLRSDGGVTFDQATGLDFALMDPMTSALSVYNGPGDGGDVLLRNPSAALTTIGYTDGQFGKVLDIPDGMLAPGAVNMAGFYTFTFGTSTLTFDLNTIIDVVRTPASGLINPKIAIDGTGILHLTGYDDVYATFSLNSTNNGGGFRAAFASSVATGDTPIVVPEPVSLALLGMGLAGMGILRRRKSA